jgi:hypothetical protein
VRKQVQIRLERHSYMRIGSAYGKGRIGYGFHSLLGAMWFQMGRMLDDTVEKRRFEWCGRVIAIEPGEVPRNPVVAKNVRGKHKTHKNKSFCNDPLDKTKSNCRANYNNYKDRTHKGLGKLLGLDD